jgi:hypothetical protein
LADAPARLCEGRHKLAHLLQAVKRVDYAQKAPSTTCFGLPSVEGFSLIVSCLNLRYGLGLTGQMDFLK